MDSAQAFDSRASFTFLDVRTPHEFEAGYVEGSVHIPLQELPTRYQELDRSRPLVVVCQVGQRSGLAAEFLRARGLDAQNLEGGLEEWMQAGYPLKTGEGASGNIIDGVAKTLER